MIVMLIVLLRAPEANSTAPVVPIKSSGDLAVNATVFHWHFTLPGRRMKIKTEVGLHADVSEDRLPLV